MSNIINDRSRIFNIKIENRFTTLPNCTAEDPNLSWKSKGLLWYLASRPNDWCIYVSQLATVCQVGSKGKSRDAIKSMIRELIEQGYMSYKKTRNEKGQWQHDYYVFPMKISEFQKMFPETDYPSLDNPAVILNTEATKKGKEEKRKRTKEKEEPPTPPKPPDSKPPEKGRARKAPSSSPEGLRLSKLLFSKIRQEDEAAEEPNFDRWAKQLDMMHEKGRAWEEIEKLIEFSRKDEFWKKAIFSTASLRKHASQVKEQMLKPVKESPAKQAEEKEKKIKEAVKHCEDVRKKLDLYAGDMRVDLYHTAVRIRDRWEVIGYLEPGFKQMLESALRKGGYWNPSRFETG